MHIITHIEKSVSKQATKPKGKLMNTDSKTHTHAQMLYTYTEEVIDSSH